MHGTHPAPLGAPLGLDQVAQYRRQGFLVLPGALGPAHVQACRQALVGLASFALPRRETSIAWEAGEPPAGTPPEERVRFVRKFMDFCADAPALHDAAMSAAVHDALDAVLGRGRVLFQEMALVKPPLIGGEKPWHQDCAYFRVTDPSLVVGVWIALDAALPENGCMEVIPGSHLWGPMPHVHENDFNRCRIPDELLRRSQAVKVPMQPGDALLFSGLLQHYTAPNRSALTRQAVQFHFHQQGAVWGSLEEHRRLFHDEAGAYAGCTVAHADLPGGNYNYREGGLARAVVPVDTAA